MDKINIILWTISLILAIAGISFGIIASINATKANHQIKELVSDQMVSEEANKYFFEIPNNLNAENRVILKKLKNKDKVILFTDYSLNAAQTRMPPMSVRIEKYLKLSEFKDLTAHYTESKIRLDKKFKGVIRDYEILASPKPLPKIKKTQLVKYHEEVVTELKLLLKEYYTITSK